MEASSPRNRGEPKSAQRQMRSLGRVLDKLESAPAKLILSLVVNDGPAESCSADQGIAAYDSLGRAVSRCSESQGISDPLPP